MNRGCSNSPLDLGIYVLSRLQFVLVQKYSCGSICNKAIVDIAGEAFLHIRTPMIYENVIYIVVGIAA